MNDNRASARGGSSSKILFAVILLSILICAVAVLVWVRILETQNISSQKETSLGISDNAGDKAVPQETVKEPEKSSASASVQVQQEEQPTVVNEETPAVPAGPDLSIDAGLDIVASTAAEAPSDAVESVDYISSSSYGIASDDASSSVVEQGVEMKKPLIAQNLSISQQSSFSKDMVKYQEYRIKEGDSLLSIADSFGLSVQTIVSVNQIKSTMDIWIGSVLQIPDRDGTLYIVKDGDTLLSITQQYELGISPKALGDVNGILEDSLEVGQKLFIPYETLETSGTITSENELSFMRPAEGTTIGMYNRKVANPIGNDSMQLDGILIQAQSGTQVLASESGKVVDKGFNDNGSGFVKLMHANGYTTFYNYLGDIYVDTAETVEKGQMIAQYATGTSNYNPPVIFFRIEQGGVAFDPEQFF